MTPRPIPRPRRREAGVTLVMALIMLVLLTLLALTSFNLGNANLQIVGNMQQREQTIAAANEVLEETISNTKFFRTPQAALPNPCGGSNQRCIDTNGDGKEDVHVVLTPAPTCAKVQIIKGSELDVNNSEEDRNCSGDQNQNFGTAGAVTGNSDCANTVWDLTAVATDVATGASVKVTQGVAVRVAKDDVATNCPQPGASP
jgi:Tfp pilus assembly protein PilX